MARPNSSISNLTTDPNKINLLVKLKEILVKEKRGLIKILTNLDWRITKDQRIEYRRNILDVQTSIKNYSEYYKDSAVQESLLWKAMHAAKKLEEINLVWLKKYYKNIWVSSTDEYIQRLTGRIDQLPELLWKRESVILKSKTWSNKESFKDNVKDRIRSRYVWWYMLDSYTWEDDKTVLFTWNNLVWSFAVHELEHVAQKYLVWLPNMSDSMRTLIHSCPYIHSYKDIFSELFKLKFSSNEYENLHWWGFKIDDDANYIQTIEVLSRFSEIILWLWLTKSQPFTKDMLDKLTFSYSYLPYKKATSKESEQHERQIEWAKYARGALQPYIFEIDNASKMIPKENKEVELFIEIINSMLPENGDSNLLSHYHEFHKIPYFIKRNREFLWKTEEY